MKKMLGIQVLVYVPRKIK